MLRSFIFLVVHSMLALTPALADATPQHVTVKHTSADVQDWQKCLFTGALIPFDQKGKFHKECAPSALYTWTNEKGFNATVSAAHKGMGLVESSKAKIRFTAFSPLESHAYGEYSFRIKLRDDVKFVFANYEDQKVTLDEDAPNGDPLWDTEPQRNCAYYKAKYPKTFDRLVVVSYLPRYQELSEFILCSDGPIASWSYGTKENYQEMKKEFAYFKSHPGSGDHISILPESVLAITDTKLDCNSKLDASDPDSCDYIKFRICPDALPCSTEDLDRRMKTAARMAVSAKGEIFYNKGIVHSPQEHYSSKSRFYFSLRLSEISTTSR